MKEETFTLYGLRKELGEEQKKNLRKLRNYDLAKVAITATPYLGAFATVVGCAGIGIKINNEAGFAVAFFGTTFGAFGNYVGIYQICNTIETILDKKKITAEVKARMLEQKIQELDTKLVEREQALYDRLENEVVTTCKPAIEYTANRLVQKGLTTITG